jgi:hypothetical protein
MKMNANKRILIIAIIVVVMWMFKKTYESYVAQEEEESLKKDIDTGEMTQAELDAIIKFIK